MMKTAMAKTTIKAVLLILPLAGCAGQLGGSVGQGFLGGGLSAITQGGQITPITNLSTAIILQEAQDIHNLLIALQAIQTSNGMVTTVTPPPVVTQPSPAPTPTPPMPPPPPPTTAPSSPSVPTGPTSLGVVAPQRKHQSIREPEEISPRMQALNDMLREQFRELRR